MDPDTTALQKLAPKKPGLDQAPTRPPVSKEHTEEEWEAKKGLIQQLYIVENRKLIEVMSILEAKHRFSATGQMFKKRMKKWGFRKRSYTRSQQNSTVSTPVTVSDVTTFDDSEPEIMVIESTSPVQTCLTAARLTSVEPQLGLESVLHSVFSWNQGKLELKAVDLDPMSRYLSKPNQPPMQDSRTMHRTFELVFDLWSHGKGTLAGRAARRAFFALEYVLTEDHPDVIWHILDTIYDMVDRGHLQLLGMFLSHSSLLARSKLPANHPLLRILEWLKRCDFQTESGRKYICHVLRQAWLRNVDLLGDSIGKSAPQQLWLYEQLIWDGRTRLRKGCDLGQQKAVLSSALAGLSQAKGGESEGAENDSDGLRVDALMLEFTQMDLRDTETGEKLAVELLNKTGGVASAATPSGSAARFHAYGRKMLARIYEGREDYASAEENLRLAIHMREVAHGATNDLRVVRDMWVLAAHLRQVDRAADAERVADEAIQRASQYLDGGVGVDDGEA